MPVHEERPDDVLQDHWVPRPGWPAGTRYLTWHLLPPPGGPLADLAEATARALAAVEGLAPVPPAALHCTVQGVGPEGDVAPGELDRLVEATATQLDGVPPVHLDLAPPASAGQGVLVEGRPVEPVARVRAGLRRALAQVLGPDRVPGGDDQPLRPHLSLAYAHGPARRADVERALARVGAGTTPARFDRVSLLRLRREERAYRWDVLAAVPLAGAAATTAATAG